jgi:hypothetical protein
MIPSTQHIIRSVIESLQKEVLPHMEQAAIPAASVRACLMLLTHVEQRLGLEGKMLFEDNLALQQLLRQAQRNTTAIGLDAALVGRLTQTLQAYSGQPQYFDLNQAAMQNQAFQEILTDIIQTLGRKLRTQDAAEQAFRESMHAYLEQLRRNEFKLVEKAAGMAPV